MDLGTIASLAAIASCVIGYLTYRIQKSHLETSAEEKAKLKNAIDNSTEIETSELKHGSRQKNNIFNSRAVTKVQEFSVAKIPFFSKNIFERIISQVVNAEKRNSGLYAWDGYGVGFVYSHNDYIFTSCDCYLAVNVWSKHYGRAVARLEGDPKSSYSTTFMRLSPCGSHLIFGNGESLFYSCDLSRPVKIDIPKFEFKTAFFDKNSSFLFVHKEGDKIHLSEVSCDEMPSPNIKKVFDITEINSSSCLISIKYIPEWIGEDLICAYSYNPWYTPDEASNLIIIDREGKSLVSRHKIYGLQNLHVDEENKIISMLSNEVSIYDENFDKMYSMELEQRWSQSGTWVLGSVAGRPCGKLIAYTIYNDGEISICGFPESKVIKKVKSFGIYNRNLKWSSSGRYLAYISYDEDSRDHYYTVYDYTRDEDVFRHATHFHITGNPIEEWMNEKYVDELMILKDARLLEWLRFR